MKFSRTTIGARLARTGLVFLFASIFATTSIACQKTNVQSDKSSELKTLRSGAEIEDAKLIVILMHGYGAKGDDLVSMYKAMKPADTTAFVFPEAPNKLARRGYAWFTKPADYAVSRTKIIALMKQLREKNADAKFVLGGFSQGAMLASNFVEKDAGLVAGLMLFSPSGKLEEELTGDAKQKPLVFLAHGRTDNVLPFSGSEALRKKLTGFKYEVDWQPFDGKHTIPAATVSAAAKFMRKFE